MDELVSMTPTIMEVTVDIGPDNRRLRPRTSLKKDMLETIREDDRERRRQTRAAMTPEEREVVREKAREHQRRRRAALTPEEKEAVRQLGRERMRQKRANMTPDQKEAKKRVERERMRIKRASMDPNKKEIIRKQDRERMRHKRASLDPVERELQRQKDRERARKKREEKSSREHNGNLPLEDDAVLPQCQEEPQSKSILQIAEFSNWTVQHLTNETAAQPPLVEEANVGEDECRFVVAQPLREASDGQPAEVQWQWKYTDKQVTES